MVGSRSEGRTSWPESPQQSQNSTLRLRAFRLIDDLDVTNPPGLDEIAGAYVVGPYQPANGQLLHHLVDLHLLAAFDPEQSTLLDAYDAHGHLALKSILPAGLGALPRLGLIGRAHSGADVGNSGGYRLADVDTEVTKATIRGEVPLVRGRQRELVDEHGDDVTL